MNMQGKRKFTIALLSLILSFILGIIGVVDGSNWVAAVGLIVGLFGGANAWEHMAKRDKGDPDEPDIKPVD